MDYDLMNLFASQEAAEAFVFGFSLAVILDIFLTIILGITSGLVDVIVAKYKKKHDLM